LEQRILAAVGQLLVERGYDGVTFEEVARRSGASRASLYRRWSAKREMVVATLKAGSARGDGPDPIDTGSLREDLLMLCRRLDHTMRASDSRTAARHRCHPPRPTSPSGRTSERLCHRRLRVPHRSRCGRRGYQCRRRRRGPARGPGALGFSRFGLIGHDRGALVAVRAGLDHTEAVDHLGILDVRPTLDTWAVRRGVHAKVAWHLYLMAQPAGLPEKLIAAVAPEFFASFLDAWDTDGSTFTAAERDHYIASSVAAVDSIVADYRATAGIDLEMDEADRAGAPSSPCRLPWSPRTGAHSPASTPPPSGGRRGRRT
jgi:AcrR family transcriptional regulator